MARPTAYTPELAAAICRELAEGKSLRAICRDEQMPGASTVFRWLDAQEAFREQYARAREWQAESLMDEILDIADDASRDVVEVPSTSDEEKTREVERFSASARDKIRIDARFKLMGQLAPKKYGKKLDVTSGGEKMQVAVIEVVAPPARQKGGTGE